MASFLAVQVQVQRFCAGTTPDTRGVASGGDGSPDSLVCELLDLFQGEFDNYDQVRGVVVSDGTVARTGAIIA